MFVSDKLIAVNYVDDTLFFSPKIEYIDDIMKILREGGGLDLNVEDDVVGFLAVSIVHQPDGSILVTQSELASKTVEALLKLKFLVLSSITALAKYHGCSKVLLCCKTLGIGVLTGADKKSFTVCLE